jgi:integrase
MMFLNKFLNFAVDYKIISCNNAKAIESFKEDSFIKSNFTDNEIVNILNYNYPINIKNLIFIAIYSGLRLSEIVNLTNSDIKKDSNNIYYFDIKSSKTKSGIRKVPIHKDILSKGLI